MNSEQSRKDKPPQKFGFSPTWGAEFVFNKESKRGVASLKKSLPPLL